LDSYPICRANCCKNPKVLILFYLLKESIISALFEKFPESAEIIAYLGLNSHLGVQFLRSWVI
jgi:hypothetical protein